MMSSLASSEKEAPQRRLLVINPNINPTVTQRVRQVAEAIVTPETSVTVVNPAEGPFSIETMEHRDAAVPQVLDLVRRTLNNRFNAYVFACFDDIALFETREMTGVPVVGTCEAGIAAARTMAARFSIITTVHSAVPGIHRLLARYGAADICTVRAAGIGVAAAAGGDSDTERRILSAVREAVDQDGAKAILLGSGGLTGRANDLEQQFGIPVIDGVAAAIKMAEGLVYLRSQIL
ncbi:MULTISPECIES: aspartate/glutamate racemase family protein [Rhizobium/Agrobacterium group]|uniref:Aspartate/glutamate racemase family protein n=2 Tax=Neorhizobium TaxID=1525371 RepID=A0ABV0MAY9_9HYPH|nr:MULTISPECIES: aspartate/glutamate racemase family protein [Rhizobium/Agrobacterium group]MCC2613824.1 aspartate/glutamate racemase family protein [Neorhizobium petrolearium]WGI72133.1 aspartate/glutamate racemase family protein [Neorhizobium petrolearium]